MAIGGTVNRPLHAIGLLVSTGLLVLFGLSASGTAFILAMIGLDGCPDGRWICHPVMMDLLPALPAYSFLVGVVVAVAGGGMTVAHGRKTGPWIFWSWALPVAVMVLSLVLALSS